MNTFRLTAALSLLFIHAAFAETAKGVPISAQPATVATTPGFPAVEAGAFSIAVVPDTQFYAEKYPDIFHRQTQWIADNVKKYDIRFVMQMGDVTENATDVEWEVARAAFKRLDGVVPYSLAPGNHDYGGRLQIVAHRSPFSNYFPVSLFQGMPTFGAVYDKQPEKTDNHFHQFEAGGRKWLVIALEFGPRDDVLRWAGDVAAAHPQHSVILITHAYIDPKQNALIGATAGFGKASDPELPDVNMGTSIWKKLASQQANIVAVICGHACYTSHREDKAADGHTVHGIVVDYQKDVKGGNGWMRLLQVLPDGKTLRSRDFSTELGVTCTMPDRSYDFVLPPPAPSR
jgi:Calcineurin-like phosphoesterase